MTPELHKRIEKATRIMAKAGFSVRDLDLVASMRAVSKAMISFKDVIESELVSYYI